METNASNNSSGVKKTVSGSRAKIMKRVEAGDTDGKFATTGFLLKLMDICACLAAENHCLCSCVTISLDDLSVGTDVPIESVLEIVGQVNNAFNTSMEVGVVVYMESLTTGQRAVVCNAFFVFVALDSAGKKMKVPPIQAETVEEHFIFRLAEERRAIRLKKRALLQSMSEPQLFSPLARRPSLLASQWEALDLSSPETGGGSEGIEVPYLTDVVHELVLPGHANHHGNTFGGQIMEWMSSFAEVIGARQIHTMVNRSNQAIGLNAERSREEVRSKTKQVFARASVSCVDALVFEGPSRTGDRIILTAKVTACFKHSLEVELQVEAREVSASSARRINTGFLTVTALDTQGNYFMLPTLQDASTSSEDQAVQLEAKARRTVREALQRMFAYKSEPVVYHEELAEQLSITNVYGLLRAAHSHTIQWEQLMEVHQGQVVAWCQSPCAVNIYCSSNTWGLGLISFKYTLVCSAPTARVSEAIMDLDCRAGWDLMLREGRVVEQMDSENSVVHEVFEALTSDTPHDYALLRSVRRIDQYTVIATRSITHHKIPERRECERGTVLPSGFILSPQGDGQSTEVTYIVQIDPATISIPLENIGSLKLLLYRNAAALYEQFAPSAPVPSSTPQPQQQQPQQDLPQQQVVNPQTGREGGSPAIADLGSSTSKSNKSSLMKQFKSSLLELMTSSSTHHGS